MPGKIDLAFALGLPPEKVIAYFKSKGYRISFDWKEMDGQAHARAFTVAKAMNEDVLADIRSMVQKAADEGIPLEQFKRELTPRLKAKGWWGWKEVLDPKTGELRKAQLGSPRRLETIYRTNLNVAYSVGRYQELTDLKEERPNWQYVAVMDRRTRPSHAAINDRVFPANDPFWATHYPPNGWGCRCRVRALSDGDMGKKGLTAETAKGHLTDKEVTVKGANGEETKVRVTTFKDPVTGKSVTPDPGWSYNLGKVWPAIGGEME